MNKLTIIIGFISLVASLATIAEAKAKKPIICFAFSETTMPVDGEATKVAICTDGKKPVILTSYQVMSVKNDEGTATRAAVGYR